MLAVLCKSVDGRVMVVDEELTMAPALGLVFLSNTPAVALAVGVGVVDVITVLAVLADVDDDDDDRQFMLCCLSIIKVYF